MRINLSLASKLVAEAAGVSQAVWDKYTAKQRKAYLKKYPNSRYAQKTPTAKPSKKASPRKAPKHTIGDLRDKFESSLEEDTTVLDRDVASDLLGRNVPESVYVGLSDNLKDLRFDGGSKTFTVSSKGGKPIVSSFDHNSDAAAVDVPFPTEKMALDYALEMASAVTQKNADKKAPAAHTYPKVDSVVKDFRKELVRLDEEEDEVTHYVDDDYAEKILKRKLPKGMSIGLSDNFKHLVFEGRGPSARVEESDGQVHVKFDHDDGEKTQSFKDHSEALDYAIDRASRPAKA